MEEMKTEELRRIIKDGYPIVGKMEEMRKEESPAAKEIEER
jgi:hypothetical protein